MRRWTVLLLGLSLIVPVPADGAPKSIFRFKKPAEKAERQEEPDTTPSEEEIREKLRYPETSLQPGSPDQASEAKRGIFGEVVPEDAEETRWTPALPGVPAVVEQPIPEAPTFLIHPVPGPASKRTRTGAPQPWTKGSPGSSPQDFGPRPFVYQPGPKDFSTITGYDASVAVPNSLHVTPVAPNVPGQPPPRPRPLPRVAPYGSAIPPDRSTPPAALPP